MGSPCSTAAPTETSSHKGKALEKEEQVRREGFSQLWTLLLIEFLVKGKDLVFAIHFISCVGIHFLRDIELFTFLETALKTLCVALI